MNPMILIVINYFLKNYQNIKLLNQIQFNLKSILFKEGVKQNKKLIKKKRINFKKIKKNKQRSKKLKLNQKKLTLYIIASKANKRVLIINLIVYKI